MPQQARMGRQDGAKGKPEAPGQRAAAGAGVLCGGKNLRVAKAFGDASTLLERSMKKEDAGRLEACKREKGKEVEVVRLFRGVPSRLGEAVR